MGSLWPRPHCYKFCNGVALVSLLHVCSGFVFGLMVGTFFVGIKLQQIGFTPHSSGAV